MAYAARKQTRHRLYSGGLWAYRRRGGLRFCVRGCRFPEIEGVTGVLRKLEHDAGGWDHRVEAVCNRSNCAG